MATEGAFVVPNVGFFYTITEQWKLFGKQCFVVSCALRSGWWRWLKSVVFCCLSIWSRSRSAHGDGFKSLWSNTALRENKTNALQHSWFYICHARLFVTRRSCFCTCLEMTIFFFFKKKLYVRYSFCVGGCSLFSMVVVVFWSVVFRLFFFPDWAWSVDAKMGDRGAGCWIRWSLHFLPSIKGCLQCSICACFIVMEGRHIVS